MQNETTQDNHRQWINTIVNQFQNFGKLEASSGILLFACTVIALLWANSTWSDSYQYLFHTQFTIGFHDFTLTYTLLHWINDGLMGLFFFVVGLEIKREFLVGELASPRRALLPIIGAFGGMIVPAIIFTIFNHSTPGSAGWGIPMATDIAFAIGILAILGNRVPIGLKVMLTALAIIDDLGAVIVIAVFYTSKISFAYLGLAALVVFELMLANRLNVRKPYVYGILGFILWCLFLKSGVHATIAGIVLAFTIPARSKIDQTAFIDRGKSLIEDFSRKIGTGRKSFLSDRQLESLYSLVEHTKNVQPPMQRFIHALHPVVSFLIMPLFALANAGVAINANFNNTLSDSVSLGVICGLLVGKVIGITTFSWLAVKFRVALLPQNTSWLQVVGVGLLGGIGFTMSLFIANLAFGASPLLDSAKVGILSGSILSGSVGWLLLTGAAKRVGQPE